MSHAPTRSGRPPHPRAETMRGSARQLDGSTTGAAARRRRGRWARLRPRGGASQRARCSTRCGAANGRPRQGARGDRRRAARRGCPFRGGEAQRRQARLARRPERESHGSGESELEEERVELWHA
eukprot:scaffold73812_cov27-Tisochrysis_lutea.AAC.4